MEYLEQVSRSADISYYEVKGDDESILKRYVFSTPQTRRICNVPESIGVEYTTLMGEAMISALKNLPEKESFTSIPEEQFCVFTFLRGGLNFRLRDALYHAYGFNKHASSFMTSQRYLVDGHWHIKENQYRKLKVPDNATLVVGDVVATGITIEEGFNVFLDHLRANRSRLDNLIFFTIGCDQAERVFTEVDQRLRRSNPSYGKTIIVYIEGKFEVAHDDTDLKIKIPGTDLLRTNALVSPEFALSQYEDLAYPLERCTIYDAGSRSFDIPEYMHDVVDYWRQMRKLAERGDTLYEVLKERWPETQWEDRTTFMERQSGQWRGIDESLLQDVHRSYQERWTEGFLRTSRTPEALIGLCNRRLDELER